MASSDRVVGIIPARYESSRLPGKALVELAGKPMIQHVYERAARAASLDSLLVATDARPIVDAVEAFGGRAVLTRDDHRTGTDRLAEVASTLPDAELIVNIQGDEPLVDPAAIDAVVAALLRNHDCPMSSAMSPLDVSDADDPSIVKVVTDRDGRALYFSRAAIPALNRDHPLETDRLRKHLGLYAYRREFLLQIAQLESTPLERHEALEQLRVLENGHRIQMVELKNDRSIAVNTPLDLERVRAVLESGSGVD